MHQKSVKRKPFILGVTGQVGTGKSTAASILAQWGAGVINADLLTHRCLRRQGACSRQVIKTFGKIILTAGEIDRSKLAEMVFPHPSLLKKLEAIIHPHIRRETVKSLNRFQQAGRRVVVLDVPLLFESKMDELADLTIVIKATRRVQITRGLVGGRTTRAQLLRRIRAQWPMMKKVRAADIVVDNGRSVRELKSQLKDIWNVLKRRYGI